MHMQSMHAVATKEGEGRYWGEEGLEGERIRGIQEGEGRV